MKDAKGHGSDSRGGSNPADAHQKRIAIDTVRNPLKGQFLGGPNAQEAEQILRSKFGYGDSQIGALKGDHAAASELARGNPKASPPPYAVGTKVMVGDKLGEISHVQAAPPGYQHGYRITDRSRPNPYAERLENGNYISHARVKPVQR